jgi:hypothetical protein
MIPGKYNMVCPQGSTFTLDLTYSVNDLPVDLTGYDARMQVREKHSSTAFVLNIETNTGHIFLNETPGSIRINIPFEMTAVLVAKEYVYDLELYTPSNVSRIIEGKFIVTPEVTR